MEARKKPIKKNRTTQHSTGSFERKACVTHSVPSLPFIEMKRNKGKELNCVPFLFSFSWIHASLHFIIIQLKQKEKRTQEEENNVMNCFLLCVLCFFFIPVTMNERNEWSVNGMKKEAQWHNQFSR